MWTLTGSTMTGGRHHRVSGAPADTRPTPRTVGQAGAAGDSRSHGGADPPVGGASGRRARLATVADADPDTAARACSGTPRP